MLKKRILGVVTIKNGWAVQSTGYKQYLPLGRPEFLVENLDRWGADEILIQCIDRSRQKLGPDYGVLALVAERSISTPLIYAGGIRNLKDAVRVVNMGADRVSIDSMLWHSPQEIESISGSLGVQALIANMPVCCKSKSLYWRNYISNQELKLDESTLSGLPLNCFSEVMLTDWKNEGQLRSFDSSIPLLFPMPDKQLVLFGGLSQPAQIQNALLNPNVAAAGIGNFLSYREHAIQAIKKRITDIPTRPAYYAEEDLK
ncbi:HisA/HisF-related TIM barrel protein [Lentilitoribacter sp. EG35]|uniref:HisA/HisF-related TIM barrel protein n=1 Tax=Lentilitoribacter sp. EG35 TaxID=3234192 RepID=UPI0034607761